MQQDKNLVKNGSVVRTNTKENKNGSLIWRSFKIKRNPIFVNFWFESTRLGLEQTLVAIESYNIVMLTLYATMLFKLTVEAS